MYVEDTTPSANRRIFLDSVSHLLSDTSFQNVPYCYQTHHTGCTNRIPVTPLFLILYSLYKPFLSRMVLPCLSESSALTSALQLLFKHRARSKHAHGGGDCTRGVWSCLAPRRKRSSRGRGGPHRHKGEVLTSWWDFSRA